jgi:hypothetical protein
MNPQWHFNPRRPCDRMRDSANDAFFTAESLENLSEALVREGIQNSLDAARRGQANEREVSVRICFTPVASAEARSYLAETFEPARQHFERGVEGISFENLFGPGCGYLVLEDFGTKGLTGDVNEWRLERAEQNAFFSFFRAEGQSAKTGESLGRWGIGKQVFPAASRLHAMIGLTVRADSPAKVLMGSAVIRTHSVQGQDYQPDGWFGGRDSADEQVKPVSDETFIADFARTFGLKRGNAPGLSVVVPAVDDRLTSDDLRCGIIRSFFWPILSGELVVDLEGPGGPWRIDAETLAANRTLLPTAEAAVVEFASWAAFAKSDEVVSLPKDVSTRPDWRTAGDMLLPESKIADIRARLESNQRVGVRIPVKVRPKDEGREEKASFFTAYIAVCRDSGHRPIFLRDGIVITDIRCPLMSGNRSLVVADDPPLAGLLGDAEGVNHTQWQKDSPKFHNRYFYGPDTIKFVSRSVFEILQRLHAAETKGDPNLLLHLFYLPSDEPPIPEPGPTPPPGPVPPSPPPPAPPPRPKKFDIRRVDGGFILVPGSSPLAAFPVRVRVQAGYAVRRGDAIRRWATDDFVFMRQPLRQEPKSNGVIVSREDGNAIELEIRKPDFEFGVCGFDKRRDLVVRAIEMRGSDEADV